MAILNQLHSLVPRRSSQCHQGCESFVPGSEYFSFLVLGEQGWQREDYCSDCWREVEEKKKKIEGVEWHGKIPKKKTKTISRDEKAHLLFKDTYHEKVDEKVTYVLALYLERKKQLQRRTGVKNKLCFENPDSGETFLIEKLLLAPEELDQIISKLLDKLNE